MTKRKSNDRLLGIKREDETMYFKCDGLDLSEAINKVIKATSTKTTAPILEGIKLSAHGDSLTLSATDLELSIEKTIKAEVITDGETVVPGKLFSEYLRKLTNEQISFELNDKNQLKIAYTDSVGYIQCMDVVEFPEIKDIERGSYFEISKSALKGLISKVLFAVATDDSRPILKGIKFEVINGEIKLVALDGYRLSIATKKVENSTDDFTFVVPGRCLGEISKMLEGEDSVKVYIHSNNLMLDMEDTVVITRLLEGQFINYKQILSSNFTTTATINKSQLEDAIERASILSKADKNNLVKFDIKENVLTLTSDSEIGNVKENITVAMKGSDITIAFNSKYFTDCLRVVDDEFIKINFTNSILPCIITPSEGEDYLFLILPVRMM